MATGRCLRTLEGHTDGVVAVSLTPDGQLAVSGSREGTLRVWEVVRARTAQYEPASPQAADRIASSEREASQALAAGTRALEAGDVRVALSHLATARSIPGHGRTPEALALTHRLARLAVRGHLLSAWMLSTLEGHVGPVSAVSLTPDGRLAVSGSYDGKLRVWEMATRRCVGTLTSHSGAVEAVSLTPDGRLAVSGSKDMALQVWDVATGRCLRTLEGHTGVVKAVNLTPDGRVAVSGSLDKTLRVWEVATGRCLRTLEGHTDVVNAVSLTPDGRLAVSGSDDDALRVWEVATGRCLRIHRPNLVEVFFGTLMKAARDWFTGRWWLSAGEWMYRVRAVGLTPDGRLAVSGSEYKSLRVWDVATGRWPRTLKGYPGLVRGVSLTPDGRLAVTGSTDKKLRVWDVATRRCVRTLEGHMGPVSAVSLTADGRLLLSGSRDGTLGLWYLDWELVPREFRDWDEEARPFLTTFLSFHTPVLEGGLTRRGRATWSDADFQDLLLNLGYAGLGWLRSEGVRRELERMAASWEGPPPLV